MSYSRAVVIWCDYHDEDKMRFGCYTEFEPPAGTRFDSLAKMRGHAAKQGWTHVRDSSSIRALDKGPLPEAQAGGRPVIRMPRTAPLAAESLPVIGFVVVIIDGGSGNALRGLTNSDLMSEETAEHEAGVWRRKATEQGSSRKFEVCPVIGGGR